MDSMDTQEILHASPPYESTAIQPSTPAVEIKTLPGRELGQQLLQDLAEFTSPNSNHVWKELSNRNNISICKTLDINATREVFKSESVIGTYFLDTIQFICLNFGHKQMLPLHLYL